MFEKVGAELGWESFAESPGEGARAGPVIVWELRTMEIELWGGKRREPVGGEMPAGYLILSEQGRFAAAVGCADARGSAASENEALFRGNFPGAAQYRIDHGRLITRAPAGETDTVQSRDCNLDGRWLEVASGWIAGAGAGEASGIRRVVFGFQKMT